MSFYCCALFCSCSSECYMNYTFAPACSAVKPPVFLQSPFHSATRFSVSSVPYINCHISIQAQTELLQCILLYLFENKLVFVLFITYCSLHYLITVFEPGLWQEPQLQPGHKKQNTKSGKRQTKCDSDKSSKIIISSGAFVCHCVIPWTSQATRNQKWVTLWARCCRNDEEEQEDICTVAFFLK